MTEDADEEALKGVEAFEQAGLSADEHRKAQFGMPVGTTNTYALEGMEDMSPDEYMQAMLDKQMEERRQRRESSGGEVRAPLDSYFAQFPAVRQPGQVPFHLRPGVSRCERLAPSR